MRTREAHVLMVIILLSCRLRQLCAAAADFELAHVHGAPGAQSEHRKVLRVLVALQGAPAECRRASEGREYSSLRHVCVVALCLFVFLLLCLF